MLICDKVLHGEMLDAQTMGDGFTQLQDDMRRAHKFVLDRTLAATADAIDTAEVERVLGSCRVPFQDVWIECLQQDRPKFAAAAVDGARRHFSTQITPIHPIKRIGMLIKTLPDDRTRFTTTLLWTFHDEVCNASLLSMSVDLNDSASGPSLEHHIDLIPNPYHHVLFGIIAQVQNNPPAALAQVMRESMADWGAEPQFWLGVLALLNCRNVAETHTADVSGINRARAKRGRPLFAEHKILKLRLPGTARHTSVPSAVSDELLMRGHFVRGHFKQRKSGLFWWSDFLRGDPARMLSKSYDVQYTK